MMTKTPFHLLTTFFLLTLLPYHGNTQTSTPNQQERTILLQLQQHWSNPPSLTHWTPSSDQCTWPEITCTNGSVTSIEIINLNITQTIPPSICDLSNLTYVDFQYNYFPGSFPTFFYNCSNLQHLDLSLNSFVGTLPDDIDRLSSQLQYLNLASNNFTGSVPSSIGRLTSLKSLHLEANLFDGSFPVEIGDLLDLEDLVLSNNGFVPQSLPPSFTRLQKLKNLWMTETNLIGEIPDSIGNMSALELLDLSVNKLNGSIPDGVFLLRNLSTLYLFKNRLSGSIPMRIDALQLQVLDLSNNTLTGTIPDEIGNLTSLTGLALFFNQLSGEIPLSVGRLPSLVDFGVFTNNLSGEIPPDFGRFSNLKTFQVCENQLSGSLPNDLCANKALVGLIAFENQLTGELPESLGDCDSLETFRVHDNKLSGEVPRGLWLSLNLTTLMISNNLFTGHLPDKVSSNLSTIEIANNQFSGSIPEGISTWQKLTVFKGSNNALSGEIPQEMTSLSSLSTLALDGNHLSGSLPNILSWVSLTTLNLSRNQLNGLIPGSVGLLPDLGYLDLSVNQFSGPIPPEINHLRLSSLNLSSNRLSGTIPGDYENGAFDRSFLNNSGLCSNTRSLGLNSCTSTYQSRRQAKLSTRFIAIVSSIAIVAFLLTFLYTIYVYKNYRKRKHVMDSNWKLTSFQKLSFTESDVISSLTEDNFIGSGGSGRVYRVPINHSGEYIAVKKIWDNVNLDHKLEKQFIAEVEILGSIRHSNTVKLLCCISSDNSKLLVYEYLQNRSLDRWIHSKKKSPTISGSVRHVVLDWPKRLQIAIGAAHGLCYMHHDCSPPIVHRDVKSSNILLDSEFNAKIADFGLARMLIKDGEPNTMSVVAGSFGYMAPEYANTRKIDEKIDVFSFGVVLLELVTGKEAHYGDETSSLADWAWQHIQEGVPLVDVMDEDIKEPEYLEEINDVLRLGIMCTSRFPSSRPTMRAVLQILLQCNGGLSFVSPKKKNENDVDPLLRNSNKLSSASVRSDDSVFNSI